MGGSLTASRQYLCPTPGTITISPTPEAQGDHAATLTLPAELNGEWYNSSTEEWIPMDRTTGFAFTDAGETYQVRISVAGITVPTDLRIDYIVSAIYAPGWAIVDGAISVTVGDLACCDDGETWEEVGTIGGGASASQSAWQGTTTEEPTCHGIIGDPTIGTPTTGTYLIPELVDSEGRINGGIPGISVNTVTGSVSVSFEIAPDTGIITATYSSSVLAPPASPADPCLLEEVETSSQVICVKETETSTAVKYKFELNVLTTKSAFDSGVCHDSPAMQCPVTLNWNNGTTHAVSKQSLKVYAVAS